MAQITLRIEAHIDGEKVFWTTPDYWDCECEEGFIHKSCEEDYEKCCVCEAYRAVQPDSRLNEVLTLLAMTELKKMRNKNGRAK